MLELPPQSLEENYCNWRAVVLSPAALKFHHPCTFPWMPLLKLCKITSASLLGTENVAHCSDQGEIPNVCRGSIFYLTACFVFWKDDEEPRALAPNIWRILKHAHWKEPFIILQAYFKINTKKRQKDWSDLGGSFCFILHKAHLWQHFCSHLSKNVGLCITLSEIFSHQSN